MRYVNQAFQLVTPESDDPWGGRMILEPVGPRTFRLGAVGPTYGAIGSDVKRMKRPRKVKRHPQPVWFRPFS